MTPVEPAPTKDEITNQLERMLGRARFKGARNQADFLEFVVLRALAGKKSPEDIIGKRLFGQKFQKDESSDVRVTAKYLRQKIALYYEHEGRDDSVIIFFPPPPSDKRVKLPAGEAYTPRFRYNPNNAVSKDYQLGVYFLAPKTALDIYNAMARFQNVVNANPDHLGAHIGMLEAMCFSAITAGPSSPAVLGATEKINWALYLGKDSWHAYAAAGAAWFLSAEPQLAKQAFAKALELDRKNTLQYGWYHAFLLATDMEDEALTLAKTRAELRPEDAISNALYAAYLYTARRFESSIEVLKNAIELDRNCWLIYLVFALVEFSRGNPEAASSRLATMDYVLQMAPGHYFFPGLTALFHVRWQPHCPCALPSDAVDQITESGENPIQRALMHMCITKERSEGVIDFLLIAWARYEPVVLFLHVLPLFDEWRDDARFKDLVRARLSKRPKPPGSA